MIEALIEDLGPRDTQELVVARRIAEGELPLARTDRFESTGLNAAGRISQYQRDQGLGQEENLFSSGRSYLRSSGLLNDPSQDQDLASWYHAASDICAMKGVAFAGPRA